MCQAYEGEREYMVAAERSYRRQGYEAFQRGEARIAPDNLTWNTKDWEMGWDIAEGGRELF